MSLRQYLTIMLFGSSLCWIAVGVVMFNIDPYQESLVGFTFFYISLFFALLGTISVAVFFLYHTFSKANVPLFRFVQKSFRDSLWVSSFLVVLLGLQQKEMLHLWNIIVLSFVVVFLLLFKQSTRITKHQL